VKVKENRHSHTLSALQMRFEFDITQT